MSYSQQTDNEENPVRYGKSEFSFNFGYAGHGYALNWGFYSGTKSGKNILHSFQLGLGITASTDFGCMVFGALGADCRMVSLYPSASVGYSLLWVKSMVTWEAGAGVFLSPVYVTPYPLLGVRLRPFGNKQWFLRIHMAFPLLTHASHDTINTSPFAAFGLGVGYRFP